MTLTQAYLDARRSRLSKLTPKKNYTPNNRAYSHLCFSIENKRDQKYMHEERAYRDAHRHMRVDRAMERPTKNSKASDVFNHVVQSRQQSHKPKFSM